MLVRPAWPVAGEDDLHGMVLTSLTFFRIPYIQCAECHAGRAYLSRYL